MKSSDYKGMEYSITKIISDLYESNRYLLTSDFLSENQKESIFFDLNNPEVVTTTSDKYASCFGFTEEEVFEALDGNENAICQSGRVEMT